MSIIEPPQENERPDDELVVGDARGTGVQMRLLADGRVRREFSAHHVEVRQTLDPVEMTQVLATVLRKQERLERRVQQLEQQAEPLENRAVAVGGARP